MIDQLIIPVGTKVIDDLTGEETTIVGVSITFGKVGGKIKISIYPSETPTIGYWVDNDYMGGGRHPWEISELK